MLFETAHFAPINLFKRVFCAQKQFGNRSDKQDSKDVLVLEDFL